MTRDSTLCVCVVAERMVGQNAVWMCGWEAGGTSESNVRPHGHLWRFSCALKLPGLVLWNMHHFQLQVHGFSPVCTLRMDSDLSSQHLHRVSPKAYVVVAIAFYFLRRTTKLKIRVKISVNTRV